MTKIPTDPRELFNEFTKDYKDIYGNDLVSIILYGSSASGNYIPKKSDINFLIVLTETGITQLRKSLKIAAKWRKRMVSTPLFLTKSYITSSLDSFAIEFLNMKKHYQLVFGEDTLKEISINKSSLRLQCERELNAKLLQLRQAYLESGGNTKTVLLIIERSLTAFISIFKALLYLKNIEIPDENSKIVSLIGQELGMDGQVFLNLLNLKEGKIKFSTEALHKLVDDYISEVNKLCSSVDQLTL